MKRSVWSNLGSVALALLLSVIIWFVARYEQNPFVNRALPGVPITILNQPPDTVLYEPIDKQAALTIRAPEGEIDEAAVEMFFVSMDLADVVAGSPATVRVVAISEDDRYRVEEVSPVQQVVHLERLRTITSSVQMSVGGEPSVGYAAGSPTISPTVVLVRGAEPLVRQLGQVVGDLSLENARQSIAEDVVLEAVDAEGNPLPGLAILPPTPT